MKKTFLSMALVLSISLAFGAEIKPVAGEVSKSDYSLESKSKTFAEVIDETTIVYNFSSCGTLNVMIYEGPVSDDEILEDAEAFDEEDCG